MRARARRRARARTARLLDTDDLTPGSWLYAALQAKVVDVRASHEMEEVTTLASIPFECHIAILACSSVRDICSAAAACRDWHTAASDDALWRQLLQLVWGVSGKRSPSMQPASARAEFMRRCRLHQLLASQTVGVRSSFVRQELNSFNALLYAGVADDAEVDDTVGVACSAQALEPWPVGPGDAVCYFEAHVDDGGANQYIAVGWCRGDYPQARRQPGWERHTYGYHGDDGRAYSGSGYGKRFGPAFGTGQTVGTGLVLPRASGGQGACVFYTLDGELVGTPFKRCAPPNPTAPTASCGRASLCPRAACDTLPRRVPRPELLRPCVGLHSPGERVSVRFASGHAAVLRSSPPGPPSAFRFDINAFTTRLPTAIGGAAPSAASTSSSSSSPSSSTRHAAESRAAAAGSVSSASGAAEPAVDDGSGGGCGGGGDGDGDGSSGDDTDDGELEADGAGLASSLAEVLALVADEDDNSPETLAELRCEMRPPDPRCTATSATDVPTPMPTSAPVDC